MPSTVTTVFADDLTGACEIAGIAHRRGLRAIVAFAPDVLPAGTDILVVDTETRLLPPEQAAERVSTWLAHSAIRQRPGRIFKKIDSVLRGPIAAEVSALADATGAARILLVPGNPSLGRTVRKGEYYINDVPLNQTAFRADPHHPAATSCVIDLIGPIPGFPSRLLRINDPLPDAGLMIADVGGIDDLDGWARRLPPDALGVGSSVFFDALLGVTSNSLRPEPANQPSTPPNLLLVSGTTDPAQREALRGIGAHGLRLIEIAVGAPRTAEAVRAEVASALGAGAPAAFHGPSALDPSPHAASAIRQALAVAVREAVDNHAVQHVVIEGGATAAAIADAFGWRSFEVAREWSPGVVTVAPNGSAALSVTLKPGSYPWPAALLKLIHIER